MADITTIERPYDAMMYRTEQESLPLDSETAYDREKSGGILTDVWLNSWMKSVNYRPKTHGFMIDGKKGYIECMRLYVGEGGIEGGSLHIPNRDDAASWHIDSSGNMWSGVNVMGWEANRQSAPFSVTSEGHLSATDVEIHMTGTGIGSSGMEFYQGSTTATDKSRVKVNDNGVIVRNTRGFFMQGTQPTYWASMSMNTSNQVIISLGPPNQFIVRSDDGAENLFTVSKNQTFSAYNFKVAGSIYSTSANLYLNATPPGNPTTGDLYSKRTVKVVRSFSQDPVTKVVTLVLDEIDVLSRY